jgi:phosphoribosylanthranilate isomerase
MRVAAKICGLSTAESIDASIAGGARFVGLMFYPPSPRYVTPEQAAALAARVPNGVTRVGVFVDVADATIEAVLSRVPLELLQFHGKETPRRVAEVKARFRVPVMKTISVAGPGDPEAAESYLEVADWLLFDAKPPRTDSGFLPGGNGLAFDWELLKGRTWRKPWMLSGGLTAKNVAEAVATTGATAIDVSSGVELRPGQKDLGKIAELLAAVRALPSPGR